MTKRRTIVAILAILSLLPAVDRLEGQGIGGLIKKKVSESVKGGDKKDQAGGKQEANAATDVAPAGSKLPRALTDVTLTAFKKGLTVERDHRQATVKFLATLKTTEQYKACEQSLAASPEMQKIVMSMGDLPDNATQEQIQKLSEKMSADMQKLLLSKCGEDPGKYHNSWRRSQMEAAEAAGVKAFSAALGSASGGGGPFLSFEEQPDDNYFYRLLKEWTPPFCNLSKEAQQAAAEKGVSVPGQGQGIAFAYTAMEARLLMRQCEELMVLLSVLG
jgi:hypothetical protein